MRFNIIHIHPDKTEELIATVATVKEVDYLVNNVKYAGVWLSDTKKVLRHGKGTIVVRTVNEEPRVIGFKAFTFQGHSLYELQVKGHDKLKIIILNDKNIAGFSAHTHIIADDRTLLWETTSFAELSTILGKEMAYQVFRYYEKYLMETALDGAM